MEFTERIDTIAKQYALPSTLIHTGNPKRGPRSIESVYDELLSAEGTLDLGITRLESTDGIIIACYSDHPAIYALREITTIPVIGIAEASMYQACMLGNKFSIVTTNEAWEPLLWDAVKRYGLGDRCASVRAIGIPVLEFECSGEGNTTKLILNAAQKTIDEDGSEVICLGCAGMAGLDKELAQTLGVPVLDGVVSALKLMEGLLGYGVKTSKVRSYAVPLHKEHLNLPEHYQRMYR